MPKRGPAARKYQALITSMNRLQEKWEAGKLTDKQYDTLHRMLFAKMQKASDAFTRETRERPDLYGKENPFKNQSMKPHRWYPATLSGAKVKIQRKGQSLVVRLPTRKR
jgi:hypothetical protein